MIIRRRFRATLLYHVGQFMGKKLSAPAGFWIVLARAEDDILT
jgi:hypothetical protein